ncbi:hypothetical protein [Streptomyces sp. P17]|uniref:hypothetical protein n=1 Tax=Streptomyces sp. P17 TaxID=3074716 RepID=UPI0028F41719|nr:hypothetical protein [Streptomyces sp. P17]MDT9700638.1 hypothetical protein [Streptomyces sp. P17]
MHIVGLETLSEDDSTALVTTALGNDPRPSREPEALRELAALCGHLPLALQVAAAMLRRRRHRGIASLVAEIKRAGDPTVVLDKGNRGTYLLGRTLMNLALTYEEASRTEDARSHYAQAADVLDRANGPTEAAQARAQAETLP